MLLSACWLCGDADGVPQAISERFASGSNGLLGVVQSPTFGSRSIRYPIGLSLQVRQLD